MSNTKYWYNKASTKSAISDLLTQYNKIVTASQELAKVLTTYVCVNKKWYDDNAVVFADWWNQNKKKGAGGNLKWDTNDNKLIQGKADTYSDGEDKIKLIVQQAGRVFWISVCCTLDGLESSHQDVKKTYSQYLKAAKDSTYIAKNKSKSNDSATVWSSMMKGFGCKAWNYTKIKYADSDGKTSDTAQIANFIKELDKAMTKINKLVDNYCASVSKIATNTNEGKYWGFSQKDMTKVVKQVKELSDDTSARLKSFANNTKLALSHTSEAKDSDIKKLTTKFN